MIQLVLRSLHHFGKNVFQERVQENEGFLEVLKQVFRIHFPEISLPTYFPFPFTINIYYLQY